MRWLRKGRFRFLQGQKGISLIETVLAVAILAAIGVGLLRALDTNSRAVRTLDERVVATNLATAYFEAISKSIYDTTDPPYYDDVVVDIPIPAQYDVNYSISFSDDGHEWRATYDDETLQKITVFVSHQEKSVLSMCTFKAEK